MATTRKDPAASAGALAPDPEPATVPAEPVAEPDQPEGEESEQAAVSAVLPFISEGVRQDLEINGKATDPVTGMELVLNRDTGVITATLRT